MNYQRAIYSGTALIAASGIAVSATACGSSSPSTSSTLPSAMYYQAGYTYALVKDGPSQHQILRHAGYAKWCANAMAAAKDLNEAPPGRAHAKAAKEWVKGCNAYAASVGLPATAPPPPRRTAPTQIPAQAPSSTASPTHPQPSPSGPAPTQPAAPPAPAPSAPAQPPTPPPFCDPTTGICQQAPAPPPGGFPGGSQNICNGPSASEFGDCVPGGGINGGRPLP
jgi:hypothetical protein